RHGLNRCPPSRRSPTGACSRRARRQPDRARGRVSAAPRSPPSKPTTAGLRGRGRPPGIARRERAMSIGKPPSAVHDYAQRPARRRDAFIALWTDDLRAAHEPLLRLPAARRAELRWAHLAVTIAVAERGGPLPPDDQIAARAVGEDVRTFRAWRQALDRYGLLVTSPAGWSTRPADDELCRRAARALRRHAPDTAPTLGSVGVDRGQNPRDISGRAAPPAPPPPPPP